VCLLNLYLFFFFFSSRRRHTRSTRDWSSDVCSSDLDTWTQTSDPGVDNNNDGIVKDQAAGQTPPPYAAALRAVQIRIRVYDPKRSEERRVGKERRAQGAGGRQKEHESRGRRVPQARA